MRPILWQEPTSGGNEISLLTGTSVTEDVKTQPGTWARVFNGRHVRVGGANLGVYGYATYDSGEPKRPWCLKGSALRKEELPGRL